MSKYILTWVRCDADRNVEPTPQNALVGFAMNNNNHTAGETSAG